MSNDADKSKQDSSQWVELSHEKGVRTIQANDWNGFSAFVNNGFTHDDTAVLWRGQRRVEWKILSSLSRTGKDESLHLMNFRNAVARCTSIEFEIDGNDEKVEAERLRLWSLGQHHGLATPLTDWSIYPYVALFFAFAEPDDETEARAVFALNWAQIIHHNDQIFSPLFDFERKIKNPPYDEAFKTHLRTIYGPNFGDDIHLIEGTSLPADSRVRLYKWERARLIKLQIKRFRPRTSENARIHSQGGHHVYTPNNIPIEEWIETNTGSKSIALTKIIIPNLNRKNILRNLNKMNINYLSLFPDFDGAAKYCNMTLREQTRNRFHLREY